MRREGVGMTPRQTIQLVEPLERGPTPGFIATLAGNELEPQDIQLVEPLEWGPIPGFIPTFPTCRTSKLKMFGRRWGF